AENQGMGIGAFAYYRRVLENQRTRIIDQIIQVGRRVGAKEDMLNNLASVKSSWRFGESIDEIKIAIPEQLKVDGHNPLTLLHNALSQGVHEDSDEKCLELAGSIRVVLAKLAQKIEHALADEAEVKGAIARLLKAGREKSEKGESEAVSPKT